MLSDLSTKQNASFYDGLSFGSCFGWLGCLIPGFDGALLSGEWKGALWGKFYTACPYGEGALAR